MAVTLSMFSAAPVLVALACMATPCLAAPCAATVGELRALLADPSFPLSWRETGMDDGKPLLLSIRETPGALFLEFVKTGEGLWAEGPGRVCREGAGFDVLISAEHIRLGPAAGWLVELALSGGARFTLARPAPTQLRLATTGWSGTFSPGVK